MSDTPRLIVLDMKFSSDALEDFANRVAGGMRWSKPPLVLLPGKDLKAPGASFQQPGDVPRQQWIGAESSIRQALAAGRDVIIGGPVEACMGLDWIDGLAKASKARTAGWRLSLSTTNTPASDPSPGHPWPSVDWSAIDADGASARQIARDVESSLPGQEPETSPQRITLIEMRDGTERRALLSSMQDQAAEFEPVVIDLEARRAKVRAMEAISRQAESAHKETRINRLIWRKAEIEIRKAARAGRPVVIAADKLTETPAIDAAEHAALVSGSSTFAARIDISAPRPMGKSELHRLVWPGQSDVTETARSLARELIGPVGEPSLNDLLSAPPVADRKRQALPAAPKP
ncbi:MAG: hypothetical protein Alpg2KO_25340 [Alphaproteobacteria bacterium]